MTNINNLHLEYSGTFFRILDHFVLPRFVPTTRDDYNAVEHDYCVY